MYRTALFILVFCVFLIVPLASQAESLPACDDIDTYAYCVSTCQSHVALSTCENISGPIGCPSCRMVFTCRSYWVIPVEPTPIGEELSKEEKLSCTEAPAGTFLVYRYCC